MSLKYLESILDTKLLIEEVKTRPCLYLRNDSRYSDLDYKRIEWERVARNLFAHVWDRHNYEEKANIVLLVQKRWQHLRTCFTRELKRQKDPKWVLGIAYERKKYVYFNSLSFLKSDCVIEEHDEINGIDLPEEIEAVNTTINIETEIEELPIPERMPVFEFTTKKASKKYSRTKLKSKKTRTALNSDKTRTPLNSDNSRTSTSDNAITLSNSDTQTNVHEVDSTNFALSLVPMLNMIPIAERVDAQIKILSVLQPFVKNSGKDGKKTGSINSGSKREIAVTQQTYGKKKTDNNVYIEIKSEDSNSDD